MSSSEPFDGISRASPERELGRFLWRSNRQVDVTKVIGVEQTSRSDVVYTHREPVGRRTAQRPHGVLRRRQWLPNDGQTAART